MTRSKVRPPNLYAAFLKRLEDAGELLPGAADQLAAQNVHGDPAPAVAELVAYLRGEGSVYFAPVGKKSLKAEPNLPWLLARLPLRAGAVDELYRTLAVRLAGLTPRGEAQSACEWILRPGHEGFLLSDRDPTSLSDTEWRTLAAIRQLSTYFDPSVDLIALARRWGRDIGQRPHGEAVRAVARRIAQDAAELAPDGVAREIPEDAWFFQALDPADEKALASKTKQQVLIDEPAEIQAELQRAQAEVERGRADIRARADRLGIPVEALSSDG